mmetsp:Transcript_17014/g.34526  ORF Transcript_17014/g.34526 Transcript_17014/m.34526 type:complete len:109 (+) Transcript_17014:1466-1792(+)
MEGKEPFLHTDCGRAKKGTAQAAAAQLRANEGRHVVFSTSVCRFFSFPVLRKKNTERTKQIGSSSNGQSIWIPPAWSGKKMQASASWARQARGSTRYLRSNFQMPQSR